MYVEREWKIWWYYACNYWKNYKIERAETDAFIKQQNKRLAQLRAIERRKKEGKRIQTKPIIEELQRAGILDENGDLAIPYRDEE